MRKTFIFISIFLFLVSCNEPAEKTNAEMMVEEGTYHFPDGKGGSFDKRKFIAIWKQEDGKWKLFREIWNTDVLPPVTK